MFAPHSLKVLIFLFFPLLISLLIFQLFLHPNASRAESLSVSMQVGSTLLTLSGKSNSNTFITLKEDGSTIASTTSDGVGAFTITVTVTAPDTIHTYLLSTPYRSLSYSLNVPGNTTTLVDNIDLLYLFPSPSATPPTNSSSPSPSPTNIASPLPSPSPSPSPFNPTLLYSGTPSSPAPSFLYQLDPNQDGKLTITEVVSVVTSWFTDRSHCDLNRDKECSLADLSILLYYIER